VSDLKPPEDPVQQQDAANELSPEDRLRQMLEDHRSLDERIKELYRFPYRDQLLLQRLKKQKLQLKDMIERLKDELIPDLNA
jgi:hypothetical protein